MEDKIEIIAPVEDNIFPLMPYSIMNHEASLVGGPDNFKALHYEQGWIEGHDIGFNEGFEDGHNNGQVEGLIEGMAISAASIGVACLIAQYLPQIIESVKDKKKAIAEKLEARKARKNASDE